MDFFEDESGELDLDEVERPEWLLADEWDEELCGDDADESDTGDFSFMISELGEDKLLEWMIVFCSAVWFGLLLACSAFLGDADALIVSLFVASRGMLLLVSVFNIFSFSRR